LLVYVGQDKNPLGFGNWQRGENENDTASFHFLRASQFGRILIRPILPGALRKIKPQYKLRQGIFEK
jgi:hypothetical protein